MSNTELKSAAVDLKQQPLDDSAIKALRRMLASEVGDAAGRWTQISLAPTLLGHSGGGEAA